MIEAEKEIRERLKRIEKDLADNTIDVMSAWEEFSHEDVKLLISELDRIRKLHTEEQRRSADRLYEALKPKHTHIWGDGLFGTQPCIECGAKAPREGK